MPIPKDIEHRDVKIIYQEILVRNMFNRDSRKVIKIIKELKVGTDNETWIKGIKCGRKAMQELQSHYDGTSEGERRNQFARADINNIFYHN